MDPQTHHPHTGPSGLPLRSGRRPDSPQTIRHWLATAHDAPMQAYTEWADQSVALLPLGRRFNAVRIPSDLLHAATHTDTDVPELVAQAVRNALDGPVIHDHLSTGATYYALIPHGRGLPWLGTHDTPLLGPGTYLGIPTLEHTRPPGTYWLIPPHHRGDLCAPDAVLHLINTARRTLRTSAHNNTRPPEHP